MPAMTVYPDDACTRDVISENAALHFRLNLSLLLWFAVLLYLLEDRANIICVVLTYTFLLYELARSLQCLDSLVLLKHASVTTCWYHSKINFEDACGARISRRLSRHHTGVT